MSEHSRYASHKAIATGDLVSLYLKEIGRIPVLTAAQEIEYGSSVRLLISLSLSPELTHEQRANIIRKGKLAKKRMIEGNLRLVVSVAKKYQNRGLELMDLIQYGSIGLQRAVEKFDPTKGYKFSTYAYWWIRQGMTRAISEHSRTIRLPVHVTEILNKIKRTERELTHKLSRSPQIAEISQELGLREEQVREFLQVSRPSVSLSLKCGTEKDSEIEMLLPALQPSPLETIAIELSWQMVLDLLGHLNSQEQEIVSLSFGLQGDKALNFAEIGKRMNLSRERIRQIQLKALRKLKKLASSSESWDIEALSQLGNQ